MFIYHNKLPAIRELLDHPTEESAQIGYDLLFKLWLENREIPEFNQELIQDAIKHPALISELRKRLRELRLKSSITSTYLRDKFEAFATEVENYRAKLSKEAEPLVSKGALPPIGINISENQMSWPKAKQKPFKKKFSISIAHPKLLSKRYPSRFAVQIYLPKTRDEVAKTLKEFGKQEISEHIHGSELSVGQEINLDFISSEITFSKSVIRKLDSDLNQTNFFAKPNDDCYPGIHQVILRITDSKSNIEYKSINFNIEVTDFVFDHVSRPLLSNLTSIALGTGSLIIFTLTLLGTIDTTFGLTSGTVAGTLASAIYARFFSLYQQPKIISTP
jgi:hypothetical protein